MSEHNHAPDQARISASKAIVELKKKAASSDTKPAVLISKMIAENQPEVAFNFPTKPSMRRMILRQRKETQVEPKDLSLELESNLPIIKDIRENSESYIQLRT